MPRDRDDGGSSRTSSREGSSVPIVIGQGRHSETEQLHDLVLVGGRLHAEPSGQSDGSTWLDERWSEIAPRSDLVGPWVHYKGGSYFARGEALARGGIVVVYTSADDQVWLRPIEMWEEHIAGERYDGPRFRRVCSSI